MTGSSPLRRAWTSVATGMTRALLRLYPASFRREMSGAMIDHVRRHGAGIEGPFATVRAGVWLLRLLGSLVVNAVGAWRDPEGDRERLRGGRATVSALDFKLGLRMLVRFPGLTVVAGLAMAFTIALGTGTYQFVNDWYAPTMPFDDGDRIVEIWGADLERSRRESRLIRDYEVWRAELSTVVEIGALQSFQRNLRTERGGSAPVVGAAISAAALDLARTPPLIGRPILASDERPDAPPVVLLSYDVWQSRFAASLDVEGETVRLGSETATVVGVMPDGFGWPRNYRIWSALRVDPLAHEWGEGPGIQVVGKLAPRISLSEAQAELSTVGARLATEHPDARANVEPRVERYGSLELGIGELMLTLFRSMTSLAFLGLIVLVCGNVALLLFARTAARHSEIVVRGALGASRARIVTQLFTEALVLGLASGVVGLVAASLGYRWVLGLVQRLGPDLIGYWIDGRLDVGSIGYALLFTIIAAAIAGVVPALKATGKGFQARLQRLGTSGPGLEFGRLWSAIIVAQIAATVAFLPIIGVVGKEAWKLQAQPFGMPAEEYLMAELGYPQASGNINDFGPAIQRPGYSADFVAAYSEVKRRLDAEVDVAGVTVAEQVPGAPEQPARILVDGPSAPFGSGGHYTRTVATDSDFFPVLGVPVLAGRNFATADHAGRERVAIVDDVFVRRILENRSPIGRTFHFHSPFRSGDDHAEEPTYEIIGVVGRVPRREGSLDEAAPYVYLPLGATETYPVRMALRVGADPTDFAPRLRQIVAEVDPELILSQVRALEDSDWAMRQSFVAWFWVLLAMGGAGMTLSLAGLYSIVSFTVSRRTREIGVRLALGGDAVRVVWPVLRRALRQIAVGSAIGGVLFATMIMASELRFMPEPGQVVAFLTYLVGIALVCGLACAVPVRRALAIEPTEALRAEG